MPDTQSTCSTTTNSAAGTPAQSAAHPADRLLDAFDRIGAPICVGLDPVVERTPAAIAEGDPASRILRFSLGVLDAIRPFVACVKFQSACYERWGPPGVAALHEACSAARSHGFEVILDAKRGDIGISAEHYAAASRGHDADWTTINGYLGADGILPFLAQGSERSAGAFVLVRTSNPSGDAFQSLRIADGRTVAEAMADLVASLGASSIGRRRTSALGAVVGATKRSDAAQLRARMPDQIFLVPGYGAQGGGVDDVLPSFRADGTGAIVTASRSVLYPQAQTKGGDWTGAVARAAEAFHRDIRTGLGRS
jgi:orotidine-5'-phosphate decarboxylase